MKSSTQRSAEYIERLKERGGRRIPVDLSIEAVANLEKIKASGKFASNSEIVAAALKKLARG